MTLKLSVAVGKNISQDRSKQSGLCKNMMYEKKITVRTLQCA